MKVSTLISAIFAVGLASCTKEKALPTGRNEENLLSYTWTTYYASGEFQGKLNTTISIDSTERTIITRYDDPVGNYEKRLFDQSWKLTSIIRKTRAYSIFGAAYQMDTIKITRQPGSVRIVGSRFGETTATLTTLTDGRQEIQFPFRIGGGSLKIIQNRIGLPEYEEEANPAIQNSRRVKHYTYNSSDQLTAIHDTLMQTNKATIARVHTIVKDNTSNQALEKIMKQMIGPDLEWMLSDPSLGLDPFRLVSEYPGLLVFHNGTMNEAKTDVFTSPDNINFTHEPFVPELKFTNKYDAQGRLTQQAVYRNGKISGEFLFIY